MTTLDWVIACFALLLAVHGYTRGFLVGAVSLLGFLVGAVIGTRLGPLLLAGGDHSPYAPLFGLAGALLAGGILAGGLEGIAFRARSAVRLPLLRTLDGVLGALLTGALALGLVWLVGAIVLHTDGSRAVRGDIESSAIIGELDQILPPSGPLLNVLAQVEPLPSLTGPAAAVGPPPPAIVASSAIAADRASVVRIVGQACGLGIEGSGWVAEPGLVVTNAHVIAGEDGNSLVEPGGHAPGLNATVVGFNAHNDIAVLRVPGLEASPLRLAPSAPSGVGGAILGYPLDGPFDAQPARLGTTQLTLTDDAYGLGPVRRMISSLRGLVRPGNSGGPIVDQQGEVIGTVFASMTNAPSGAPGGFAVPNSVLAPELAAAAARRSAVGSGHCAQ